MKASVYDLSGKQIEEIELPEIFSADIRPDVVKRAVLAIQSSRRSPYGSDPLAGKKTSAHYHGSRHYRYTMMNRELARMPRIHGRIGYMALRARFAPQAVKGRKAHPPKPGKTWTQKINSKEKRLAIRSALAAAADIDIVKSRHRVHASPIVITDDFEGVKKTKDVLKILARIIGKELARCAAKKIRSGKGKMRGRKYKRRIGPLIIASKDCLLIKSARGIAGVDAETADNVNAELLAPGAQVGRAVVVTKSALGTLQKRFGE